MFSECSAVFCNAIKNLNVYADNQATNFIKTALTFD